MQDVSAFGFVINLIASNTFPNGITLSQFADDADPFDLTDVKVGDAAMGVNGDLVTWSKAAPIPVKLAVIAGSADAVNLSILFEANRVGRGKFSARDVITVTAVYPDGSLKTFDQGSCQTGSLASSAASSGRLKTRSFDFVFESTSGIGQ